jgi:molybdate transport system ATP-binding protein
MNRTAPSPGSTRPFVSIDNVSLRLYGGTSFGSVDWEILSDQHWAVIGPNGSGKSTLMKALCGHVPVTGGKIVYHFLENGASRNRFARGVLPQDHIVYVTFDSQRALLGHESPFHQARWNSGMSQDILSVSEYLSESRVRKINPYQVTEERSDPAAFMAHRTKVIELLGIEALLDRSMVQISNGERRKVLMARALLKRPQLFILDNPFTGLDRRFRAQLKEILGSLMQDDMRVMVVTTDGDGIPPGITHVLLVENNQVVAKGPRETILNNSSARSITHRGQSAELRPRFARDRRLEDSETDCQVLVHMNNVSVSYDGVQVLKQISWTVRRRENWALLGPNGAGKTTLLSLILGDNPQAYANNMTLFGRRRGSGESIWDIKKQVGWVAPELHLYFPRTVSCFDVVCSGFFDSVGLYDRCSPQQRETAMSWMQQLGTWPYAEAAFGEISEGEQRLILIARALVKRPALLVLDEPCQGLDASNRDRVLKTIETIGNHLDTSVIYVTHNPNALPKTITHVLRLNEGKITGKGVRNSAE